MCRPSQQELLDGVTRDLERGVWSIPLRARLKRPHVRGWTGLRIQAEEASTFFESGMNRGRLLGVEPARGEGSLVVVDIDVPEARALAPHLLPPTEELGGRDSAQGAHWYYRCSRPPHTRRFNGAQGMRLVELLSTGSQVVVPASIHPSGERYTWFSEGPAALVHAGELSERCQDLAIATLLVRSSNDPQACLASVQTSLTNERNQRIKNALRSMISQKPPTLESMESLVEKVRYWLGDPAA